MTTDLKPFLLARHPWYASMSEKENWPKVRAARGALNDESVKRDFLVRGKFEKDHNFATRVQLSEFAGVTEGIIERFTGAIFGKPVDISYDVAAPLAASKVDLEAWSKDIDGQGTSLTEFVRDQAPDVIGMGGVGVLVDMDPRTADQVAMLNASSDQSIAFLKSRGIPWMPRLVTYQVEEITNWYLDRAQRPVWVLLTRLVNEQESPFSPSVRKVEWLVIDRVQVQVFRSGFKDLSEGDQNCLRVQDLWAFEKNIQAPEPIAAAPHSCGCVPIAWLGDPKHPLSAPPILMGTVRADIAGFNEDSQGRFARYLHNVPAPVLKTAKQVDEVIRDPSVAIVLNPEDNESFEYVATPSDGFEITMKSVENSKLDGFRQAGADPTGMFEQTSTPESGTAKKSRFSNTEARLLSKMAGWFQSGHWSILELVTRRFSRAAPPLEQKAFAGSVRYPSQFDQEEILDLIDQFGASKDWLIDSATFLQTILTRIALTIMGDVSEEKKKAVSDDIAKLTPAQLRAALVVLSAPTSSGGLPGVNAA